MMEYPLQMLITKATACANRVTVLFLHTIQLVERYKN